MITTQKIADAIGRSRMAEALCVGPTAISNAVVGGKFPASWIKVMEILCEDAGIDCPPELFGVKSTAGVRHANARPDIQGRAQ